MAWYQGWNVLAVGLIFQAVSFGIGIYCFTFWVAPWSAEFAAGRGEVMTVFLGMQVAMGVLAPFAGRAMDRLSIRALVCGGALCFALALLLAGRASALWQIGVLYGTLLVAGILLAGPLAAQTLVTRWFVRRRGLALPPLVTALQSALGWREANTLLALLVVALVIPPVWLVVRNSPVEAGVDGEAAFEPASPAVGPPFAAAPDWSVGAVLRSGTFWLIVLVFTALGTAFGGVQQNLAPFALDRGIDARSASWLVSGMALVMALAKVFFGALADRVDVRWLLGSALLVLAAALLWMTLPIGYVELAAICGLLGLAAGANLPLLAAVVSRRFGVASFGLVTGMVGPFFTLAALGPWLAGYFRDVTGSYSRGWLVLSALLVPAALALAFLRLPSARGDAPPARVAP